MKVSKQDLARLVDLALKGSVTREEHRAALDMCQSNWRKKESRVNELELDLYEAQQDLDEANNALDNQADIIQSLKLDVWRCKARISELTTQPEDEED